MPRQHRYRPADIHRVTRTARACGAVGPMAIVPRYVAEHIPKNTFILDFGAGRGLLHTRRLKEAGFRHVFPYDIGMQVPAGSFGVVMASNVLNVAPNRTFLRQTIKDIASFMSQRTLLVANFPDTPRGGAFTGMDRRGGFDFLTEELRRQFLDVTYDANYRIFFARRPRQEVYPRPPMFESSEPPSSHWGKRNPMREFDPAPDIPPVSVDYK